MTPTDESLTPRHPIAVVADRTRLSQDVLRVWERRYQVVEPARSASGQRLYSDADIERLRLLSMATGMGRSISHVAGLSTPDLARMVREDEDARGVVDAQPGRAEPTSDLVEPALARTVALDGPGLQALLHRAMLSLGLTTFLDAVATPLLTRIGTEWHAGRLAPSQEHLASAIIHRVVTSAMQTLQPMPGAPGMVVATPAGERHEIGAVLAAAAATGEGWRVTYLGIDLPASDIADAAIRTDARAVGLSIIFVAQPDRVADEITKLRDALPIAIPLLIGGGASLSLAPKLQRDGIRFVRDLTELRQMLRREGAAVSA